MLLKSPGLFFVFVLMLFLSTQTVQSQEWNSYNTDNSDLPSNNVLSITIDNNEIMWFGTDSGLVKFDGENWTTYTTTSHTNLADNHISDVSFVLNENQSYSLAGNRKWRFNGGYNQP